MLDNCMGVVLGAVLERMGGAGGCTERGWGGAGQGIWVCVLVLNYCMGVMLGAVLERMGGAGGCTERGQS